MKMIWVTFQKAGIHCYPEAATDPNLASVSYIGQLHRHVFHFKVAIEVFHNERDIEFIQFKEWLESLYQEKTLQLDYMSCEMLADQLYETVSISYPGRRITIDIAEDGENGVTADYLGS